MQVLHRASALALALVLLAEVILAISVALPVRAGAPIGIRVVDNHFVDANGRPLQLVGVNRSGSEYACMANRAFFDGPSDDRSIQAMTSWHINTVRVPLNEDCWLGINGAPPAFSGSAYRGAIMSYVGLLHEAGLYAIVDLHWNAQGRLPADGRSGQGRKMADRDHAPAFWRSVALAFRNDSAVLFDLFNEPHDISWDCWRNGCATSDATGTWQVAGFQSLLDAVRGTGATNPVLVAGNRWAGDLRGWPHGLRDPAQQLAASWHVYWPGTRLDALRDLVVRPIAGTYPVVAAELGEKDCAHQWLDGFMRWADDAGISYVAWTWNAWRDCGNPVLITSYQGTPTAYGIGYRNHLAALWRDHPATRVLTPFEAFAPLLAVIISAGLFGLAVLGIAFFTVRRLQRAKRARRRMGI